MSTSCGRHSDMLHSKVPKRIAGKAILFIRKKDLEEKNMKTLLTLQLTIFILVAVGF